MSNRIDGDFTQGSVLRQLIRFATPLFLANLLQTMYSMVDTAVVGWFVGSAGISAVTTGSQITFFLTTLSMGLANAGQIILSQLKGAGNKEGQRDIIGAIFTVTAIIGVVLGVLGVFLNKYAVGWLNTPEEAVVQAEEYMIITCAGLIFVFLYNALGAVMRGLGDSKRPLLFIAIASVINVILDIIFVGPMNMGAAGAAIATVIAQMFSAAFGFIYLYRHRDTFIFTFSIRSFMPKGRWVKELLRLGVPQTIQMSAINLSLTYVLAMVNSYGVAASSAIGVGNKITQMFIMPMHATNTAGTAMGGQNIGAGLHDRVKKIVEINLIVNLCVTVVSTVILYVFAEPLIKLFDPSPEVVEKCTYFLRIQFFNLFGHALFTAYNAACLGAGNAVLSSIAFLTDGVVVRLALCILLTRVFDFGLNGIFWATTVAPIAAGVILGVYYYSGKWRTFKSKALADG